jgi:hypothetical protein
MSHQAVKSNAWKPVIRFAEQANRIACAHPYTRVPTDKNKDGSSQMAKAIYELKVWILQPKFSTITKREF